ncbi:MAG: SemiSWEET family transporter [Pedobacter sp.]|jgi:MtN3 and saliva related transmembrane protein|uniref:SemiSWEET family sugar transporter n=1 Tax=Pedobacter sp. TaxID=1411316 RepID=UPI00356B32C1
MDVKTIIGFSAGILTAISSVPQIVKILKEKKAQAVSPLMFFVLLAGNLLWCWYGVLLNELPIILTNAFSAVCDIFMIVLNYKYSKKS